MANSIDNNDVVVVVDDHQQHHKVREEDNSSLNGVPPQVKNNHSCRRRRGIPWTEGEHQLFLMGLNKFGKGDWKNISRYYVVSKTPTQVASHAQKYFCRRNSQTLVDRRRPSINDIQTITFTLKTKATSPPKINNNILAYNNNCQIGSSSMPFYYPNYYPFGGPTFTKDSNENFERYHRGEASNSNSFALEKSNNNNNNLQRPNSPDPFASMYLSSARENNP